MSNACFFLSLIKLIKGGGRHEKHHSAKSWWRSSGETLSLTCSTSRKVVKQQRKKGSKIKSAIWWIILANASQTNKKIILIAVSRLVNWSVNQHTEDKKKNYFLFCGELTVYWKKGLFKLKMLSLHQVCTQCSSWVPVHPLPCYGSVRGQQKGFIALLWRKNTPSIQSVNFTSNPLR